MVLAIPETSSNWARALTNERLAEDLKRLSQDVRFHNAADRAALLIEAARRLNP